MVSLWGTKNGKDSKGNAGNREESNHQEGEGSQQHHERRSHDTDERTRLLPPSNSGYLDPDDPAVSSNPTPVLAPTRS